MILSLKARKYINIITCPFRAIHATLAITIWEVLSLGVISPYIKFLWKHVYTCLQLDEIDDEYGSIPGIIE